MENGNLPHLPPLLLFLLLTLTSTIADEFSTSASDAISRLRQYLRIDTAHPSPDYASAVSLLLSTSQDLPLLPKTLEIAPGKPLLLLRWPGRRPSLPAVLLYSHTDVVPVEASKWSHPPFAGHLDPSTGRIYARGSQDMKSIGIQHLESIRRLVSEGFTPERTLYVVFSPDEETTSDGANFLVESEEIRRMHVGVVLDEGIPSEEEEYRVFYSERNLWWVSITAHGVPGHGAKLYDGSAMENLMRSVELVRKFRAAQFELLKAGVEEEGKVVSVNMVYLKAGTPSTPMSDLAFSSGFLMNLQPSEAEAGLDLRVPPDADAAEALEKRIAEEWAPSSRNMTFKFIQKAAIHDKFGNLLVTVANSSNPWWSLLEGAIKKAGGKLRKPEIFPASTDARYFRAAGIPAFGFSPIANTPSLLHDHNEYLGTDEYLRGIEMYVSIIREFTSFTDEPTEDGHKDEL